MPEGGAAPVRTGILVSERVAVRRAAHDGRGAAGAGKVLSPVVTPLRQRLIAGNRGCSLVAFRVRPCRKLCLPKRSLGRLVEARWTES
jgi:hypothetical protein